MRITLLIVFIIAGMFTTLNMLDFAMNEKPKIEAEIKEIKENRILDGKVRVPPGLEKEYELISQGKDPYTGEKVVEQKQDQPTKN